MVNPHMGTKPTPSQHITFIPVLGVFRVQKVERGSVPSLELNLAHFLGIMAFFGRPP
jgi:hypothetical protein